MIVTRELDWKDWGDIDERTQNLLTQKVTSREVTVYPSDHI